MTLSLLISRRVILEGDSLCVKGWGTVLEWVRPTVLFAPPFLVEFTVLHVHDVEKFVRDPSIALCIQYTSYILHPFIVLRDALNNRKDSLDILLQKSVRDNWCPAERAPPIHAPSALGSTAFYRGHGPKYMCTHEMAPRETSRLVVCGTYAEGNFSSSLLHISSASQHRTGRREITSSLPLKVLQNCLVTADR